MFNAHLAAAVALSLAAGSAAFMAPAPSVAAARSAFAPAVGGRAAGAASAKLAGRMAPPSLRKASKAPLSLKMGPVKAEYIWIGGRGGVGDDYRCKTRILDEMPKSIDDLPLWNYDGSSTGQAPGDDSEVFLKPAFMCHDPIRGGDSIYVLCEMLTPDMKPLPTSTRSFANDIFNKALDEEPWFGIEQEYTLFADGRPLGWPESSARQFNVPNPLLSFGYPGPQGPYYCSVGYDVAFGRDIVERHLDACLAAGLKIGGINGEVLPGQWEYQIGPCVGIEAGDHMHISRFLLHRICEEEGVVASFDPKPVSGDWNGSGCHTNFSTKKMRSEGGFKVITDACDKLGEKHQKHIKAYGEGNERRLTGDCETNSIDDFRYAVADRGASIRIPRFTKRDGKGYLEDRRPASNIDPYIVTALIFDTTCLNADTDAFGPP